MIKHLPQHEASWSAAATQRSQADDGCGSLVTSKAVSPPLQSSATALRDAAAPSPHPRNQGGFALIIVISFLALMLILTVGLLSSTSDGKKMSHGVHEEARARWTAQSSVNLALAQLQAATTDTFDDGSPKPWTSQPGAIRVHSMDGELEKIYKLYSSSSLTADSLAETANDLPAKWQTFPSRFVDLNEPHTQVDGSLRFPIVDPRLKTNDLQTCVEGFDYDLVAGAVGPGKNPNLQRLPMPVQWIYQLRNGELGTMNDKGKIVLANPSQRPTKDNPIVARFAFWVDDESCKININTASEGSFWDSPRADTSQERQLAQTIPSRLEYSRHPGHPAGVCLSSFFLPHHRIYPAGFGGLNTPMKSMTEVDARDLWKLGRLASATLEDGTSLGGTRHSDWTVLWPKRTPAVSRQSRYSTTDELVFDEGRNGPLAKEGRNAIQSASTSAATGRVQTAFFERHPEARERLSRSDFFLTATSSAPETTLFGTPRVAMWPVSTQTLENGNTLGDPQTSRDTVYGHKVKLATTVKDRAYVVQRSEPGNGMNDFDRHGGGGNKLLFEYLQRLTSRDIPGFKKPGFTSFADKYGPDRDALLIEMMDYIRASNFADGQLSPTMQFSILCPGVEHHGFGQVSPLQMRVKASEMGTSNHIRGIGRSPAISEVALIIACRAEKKEDGSIVGQPTDPEMLVNPGDREIEVGFFVELFVPGHGWTDYCPFITTGMFGGAPGAEPKANDPFPMLYLNDQPLLPYGNSSGKKRSQISSAEFPPSGWHGTGGAVGLRALSEGALVFRSVIVKANEDGSLPPLKFRGTAGQANQLKIALYDVPESVGRADLLQVVPLVLPDIGLDPAQNAEQEIALPTVSTQITHHALENRAHAASKNWQPLITQADVVQSLAPVHGDYRVSAMQRWVESRGEGATSLVFSPHPQWGQQSHAHTLRDASLPGSGGAGLIPGIALSHQTQPDLPATLVSVDSDVRLWQGLSWHTGTLENALNFLRLDGGLRGSALPWITGDFDNGFAGSPDGAYCNRPDDCHWAAAVGDGTLPYFANVSLTGPKVPPVSLAAFSPQRLIPSPVMFGSLPTGVRSQVPWQTLLFRPQLGHYGASTPPDHLLLDLFWQPVLEPEPVSHDLETAGKINLNHQMLPFRHITRATALHAAMKAETLMAIPDAAAPSYKDGSQPAQRFRRHISASHTLDLWKTQVFDQGNVFLTPSQICEHYLVPEGEADKDQQVTEAAMRSFWETHRLTGDNTKEKPYAHLLPRLTTRSNAYRVHFIAESLVKSRQTAADTFDPSHDRVTARKQGNTLLRRRLNLDHPDLPDYQTAGRTQPLDGFYEWNLSTMDW